MPLESSDQIELERLLKSSQIKIADAAEIERARNIFHKLQKSALLNSSDFKQYAILGRKFNFEIAGNLLDEYIKYVKSNNPIPLYEMSEILHAFAECGFYKDDFIHYQQLFLNRLIRSVANEFKRINPRYNDICSVLIHGRNLGIFENAQEKHVEILNEFFKKIAKNQDEINDVSYHSLLEVGLYCQLVLKMQLPKELLVLSQKRVCLQNFNSSRIEKEIFNRIIYYLKNSDFQNSFEEFTGDINHGWGRLTPKGQFLKETDMSFSVKGKNIFGEIDGPSHFVSIVADDGRIKKVSDGATKTRNKMIEAYTGAPAIVIPQDDFAKFNNQQTANQYLQQVIQINDLLNSSASETSDKEEQKEKEEEIIQEPSLELPEPSAAAAEVEVEVKKKPRKKKKPKSKAEEYDSGIEDLDEMLASLKEIKIEYSDNQKLLFGLFAEQPIDMKAIAKVFRSSKDKKPAEYKDFLTGLFIEYLSKNNRDLDLFIFLCSESGNLLKDVLKANAVAQMLKKTDPVFHKIINIFEGKTSVKLQKTQQRKLEIVHSKADKSDQVELEKLIDAIDSNNFSEADYSELERSGSKYMLELVFRGDLARTKIKQYNSGFGRNAVGFLDNAAHLNPGLFLVGLKNNALDYVMSLEKKTRDKILTNIIVNAASRQFREIIFALEEYSLKNPALDFRILSLLDQAIVMDELTDAKDLELLKFFLKKNYHIGATTASEWDNEIEGVEHKLILLACEENDLNLIKIVGDRVKQLFANPEKDISVELRKVSFSAKIAFILVRNQNLEALKYLQKCGFSFNNLFDKETGKTLLMEAVTTGNIEMVRYLVEELKYDVNAQDDEKKSVLMYAAQKNNLEIAKYLVEKSADVKHKNKIGKNALSYAFEESDLDLIKYLSDILFSSDPIAMNNVSLRLNFVTTREKEIVDYLFDRIPAWRRWTTFEAVSTGSWSLLEERGYLLDVMPSYIIYYFKSFSNVNENINTFQYAIAYEQLEMAQMILKRYPNKRKEFMAPGIFNPMVLAFANNNFKVIDFLRSEGLEPAEYKIDILKHSSRRTGFNPKTFHKYGLSYTPEEATKILSEFVDYFKDSFNKNAVVFLKYLLEELKADIGVLLEKRDHFIDIFLPEEGVIQSKGRDSAYLEIIKKCGFEMFQYLIENENIRKDFIKEPNNLYLLVADPAKLNYILDREFKFDEVTPESMSEFDYTYSIFLDLISFCAKNNYLESSKSLVSRLEKFHESYYEFRQKQESQKVDGKNIESIKSEKSLRDIFNKTRRIDFTGEEKDYNVIDYAIESGSESTIKYFMDLKARAGFSLEEDRVEIEKKTIKTAMHSKDKKFVEYAVSTFPFHTSEDKYGDKTILVLQAVEDCDCSAFIKDFYTNVKLFKTPEERYKFERQILYLAIKHNRNDIFREIYFNSDLINFRRDIDKKIENYKYNYPCLRIGPDTLLGMACAKGNYDIAKLLLENGSNIECLSNGKLPLEWSARGGHHEFIAKINKQYSLPVPSASMSEAISLSAIASKSADGVSGRG